MTRTIGTILALLAMASCGTVKRPDDAKPAGALPTALAARPHPLPPELKASATPSLAAGSSSVPSSRASATASVGRTAAPRTFHVVGRQGDPAGDVGLTAPPYVDLTAITIEDDGITARIVVDMRGDIPASTASDEVVGVGVNLYATPSASESDYQLFADGEPDGWFAYLTTPKGLVDFPGTFRLGGNRMVFELPWKSLGDISGTSFDAFADWTKGAADSQTSADRAPDKGRTTFAR